MILNVDKNIRHIHYIFMLWKGIKFMQVISSQVLSLLVSLSSTLNNFLLYFAANFI